jgi:hypothetical protein
VVRAQVELLSEKVVVEMFQRPHYGRKFSSGHAIIPLSCVKRVAVVSYDTLVTVLYLGEHSSDPEVTCVCVHYEPLSWLGVGENRGSTQGSL